MRCNTLEDLQRLVNSDETHDDDDALRRQTTMTTETSKAKKAIFSTLPEPRKSSRDPGDILMRFSAKWRRERNLDDSHENITASVAAVLSARPKLAEAYMYRPDMLARAGGDAAVAFEDVEMECE